MEANHAVILIIKEMVSQIGVVNIYLSNQYCNPKSMG